jgi:16S rRNA processing protein RimM
MPSPGDMVLIGIVTGAHGIKGEVKLKSFAAEPSGIESYGPLVTSSGEAIEIERLRPQKEGYIAVLKGVRDRNGAAALKGCELFIPRGRLPAARPNEVYVHDIIGLSAHLKNGGALGEVVAVPNFGGGDLLEIRVEGRKDTLLVPFTDSFVPDVDIARGMIMVDLPDGYMDEGE